jgi:hypothetical protein
MKKEGNRDWEAVVDEHIVRAVTVRLSYLVMGNDAGDLALEDEKRRGYIYVPEICERLKEYESKRTVYPSLAAFYPEIVKIFEKLTREAQR